MGVWLVIRQVLANSAVGLSLGILVLSLAGLALAGLLFGVRSADPVTMAAVTAILGNGGARRREPLNPLNP